MAQVTGALLNATRLRISRGKFRCNSLTTVQFIQDYASLIILAHIVEFCVAFGLLRAAKLNLAIYVSIVQQSQ